MKPEDTGIANAQGADLRGFRYALEALRRQRHWKADAARARLAVAAQDVAACEAALVTLRLLHRRTSEHAAAGAGARIDADRHGRALAYLAGVQAQIAKATHVLDAALQRQVAARQDYALGQRRLEAVTRHRDAAAGDYSTEWLRQQSVEADRDWLARKGRTP